MESSEKVRFVFSGKREVRTELPLSAVERLFLGQKLFLDPEMISQESLGLEGSGVHFSVTGDPVKKDNEWVVPANQQMSSGNGS